MFCLISVVFIAELIILYNVLLFLIQADRQVCALTTQIDKGRTKLKWNLCTIEEITEDINGFFPVVQRYFTKSKRNISIRLINELAQTIILFFFKPKYKKILLGLKTGIGVARKFLKV
jgi:hypothetical protein